MQCLSLSPTKSAVTSTSSGTTEPVTSLPLINYPWEARYVPNINLWVNIWISVESMRGKGVDVSPCNQLTFLFTPTYNHTTLSFYSLFRTLNSGWFMPQREWASIDSAEWPKWKCRQPYEKYLNPLKTKIKLRPSKNWSLRKGPPYWTPPK